MCYCCAVALIELWNYVTRCEINKSFDFVKIFLNICTTNVWLVCMRVVLCVVLCCVCVCVWMYYDVYNLSRVVSITFIFRHFYFFSFLSVPYASPVAAYFLLCSFVRSFVRLVSFSNYLRRYIFNKIFNRWFPGIWNDAFSYAPLICRRYVCVCCVSLSGNDVLGKGDVSHVVVSFRN